MCEPMHARLITSPDPSAAEYFSKDALPAEQELITNFLTFLHVFGLYCSNTSRRYMVSVSRNITYGIAFIGWDSFDTCVQL